jgi:Protein of unknown function (DUF721).
MKKADTQSLSKALDIFFEENPVLAEKLAEVRLMESWEKTLGNAIAHYTGNLFIKNKCLYVKLNSSVVKSELMMCRERLIQNLNNEAGRIVIDNIIFT